MKINENQEKLIAVALILAIALIDYFLIKEREINVSDMVWLEGDTYTMGSDRGMPDESPAHAVTLDGFWIDRFEVSNLRFAEFVEATAYQTEAERYGDSLVFVQPRPDADVSGPLDWWQLLPGAQWRAPSGETSSIEELGEHPVVQVSYADADAYCNWRGMSLPTEAQFEFAARGGNEGAMYSWGNTPRHEDESLLNHWQGQFPKHNDNHDGYASTASVDSFPPNPFGLYDITGNVWEWVSDWYHPDYYANGPSRNPRGVTRKQSLDPAEPGLPKRSIRGGSFLCADNYCSGFRVSARMPADPKTATNHTGFRCVYSPSASERLAGAEAQ